MQEPLHWGLIVVWVLGFIRAVWVVILIGPAIFSLVYGFFSDLLNHGIKVTFRKITENPIIAGVGLFGVFGFFFWFYFVYMSINIFIDFLLH
jgi:hypothetical protein